MAVESPFVTATCIEATEFPDLSRRYRVTGVPKTVAGETEMEVITERVVADTGRVAAEWRMRGTFTGAPFQGIEATGRSIELRGFDLFEVERGKIKRNTAYYDGAAFARAIGLLPPQDSGAEKAMTGAFNAATKVRKGIADLRGR